MGKENQSFKQVIQSYLEERAKGDSLFAASFAKTNKNIDECCNYIIGEAMHHCVFSAGYYKRPESLILSAKDSKGNRLETIEVSCRQDSCCCSHKVGVTRFGLTLPVCVRLTVLNGVKGKRCTFVPFNSI